MVDITIENNAVSVDTRRYHSFNNKDALVMLISDIIDKAKFSGESISIWIMTNRGKQFVEEWPK